MLLINILCNLPCLYLSDDPFIRGAEFWQVHDVLLKMILTGMLIYVPSTSRAGIAILVCLIAVANLNYFTPHKNRVLFWLTQISFITTSCKYVVAIMLSAKIEESKVEEENTIIGILLVTLDVFFMSTSLIAVLISALMLRRKIRHIQAEHQTHGNNSKNTKHMITPKGWDSNTKVVPMNNEDLNIKHWALATVPVGEKSIDTEIHPQAVL